MYFMPGRFKMDTRMVYPLNARTTMGIMNQRIVDGRAKKSSVITLEDQK
jgi:hypothetical protein